MSEQTPKLILPEWAKWIARDADGSLWIYENKPDKNVLYGTWEAEMGNAERIHANAFTLTDIGWKDKPLFMRFVGPDDSPDDAPAAGIDGPDVRLSAFKLDNVNHPQHYKHGEIETLDIIRMSLTDEEYRGFLKGNVLKYQMRAPFKHEDPTEDYQKAKFYYDRLQEANE